MQLGFSYVQRAVLLRLCPTEVFWPLELAILPPTISHKSLIQQTHCPDSIPKSKKALSHSAFTIIHAPVQAQVLLSHLTCIFIHTAKIWDIILLTCLFCRFSFFFLNSGWVLACSLISTYGLICFLCGYRSSWSAGICVLKELLALEDNFLRQMPQDIKKMIIRISMINTNQLIKTFNGHLIYKTGKAFLFGFY